MHRAASLIKLFSIGALTLSIVGANALRVDAATDGQATMSAPAQPAAGSPPLPDVTGMPRIDAVHPADNAAKPIASAFAAEIPREVNSAKFVAHAAPDKIVTFEVMLPLQHQDDLMALIKAQQDQKSPLYHKWLKKGEFAQRFHASRTAVETVDAALKANGLHVINVNATETAIKASGPVSSVEKLFGTRIKEFTKQNKTYLANTTPAAHPAVFHGMDLGVLGLSNLPLAKPQYVGARFTSQTRKAKKPAKKASSTLPVLRVATFREILQPPITFHGNTTALPQMAAGRASPSSCRTTFLIPTSRNSIATCRRAPPVDTCAFRSTVAGRLILL